jgi:zinc protease
MRINLLKVALVLLLAMPGMTQPDRTEAPTPAAPKSLVPQSVHKTRLKNGIQVWIVERHQVPVVSLNLVLHTGSASDPPGQWGLATFTSSLLDEGAAGKSSLQLSDELDYLGADLSASSGFDFTAVSLDVPSERLQPSLELMADIVQRPDFPEKEVDRIKKELLTALRQQRDEPTSVASYFFPKLIYPEAHRYSEMAGGGETAIKGFDRAALRAFHQAAYRPEQATIVVVGDVTTDQVTKDLEETFGSWQAQGKPLSELHFPEAPQMSQRKVVIVDKPGAAQTTVMIGWQGVARHTEDYYALEVLNTILGDSFTSRLNQNLREKNGYTYGAGSAFVMRKERGPFYARASVQTDKTGPAVTEFFKELRGISQVVDDEELEKAKNYLAYRFPAEFETDSDIADQLTELVVYSLPEDTHANYVERIQAVTAEHVQAAAKKYIHSDHMLVLLVGDRSKIEEEIKALNLGPIEHRDRMEGLDPER